MRPVLVLRPEPGASITVKRARELGLNAIAAPLFELESVDWQAPAAADFDGLLLTSANAVRLGGGELQNFRALPVYAVGEATASAARDRGFDVAATGDSGVDRLLDSIEPELSLLHLCGEDRREPQTVRQQVTPISIYRAREIEQPNLGRIGGAVALIHSPRAGRRIAELVEDRGSVVIAAISRPAAEAVGTGWQGVESSDEPTGEALLALAARLCNIPPPE
jgi:uroporphyrinogen-III synthase